MPLIQKTVYFREEDIPKWEAVPNKAGFLHDALNSKPPVDPKQYATPKKTTYQVPHQTFFKKGKK